MSDKSDCFDIQSTVLEMLDGKRMCPSCNGSGKEELTFKYDNSDKETSCHNMLKQIDRVSRGCICQECNGEGKVDIPMWDWQRELITARKKELFDIIYKGDVLTDLYQNRSLEEEQYKLKYVGNGLRKSNIIIET